MIELTRRRFLATLNSRYIYGKVVSRAGPGRLPPTASPSSGGIFYREFLLPPGDVQTN